MVQARSPSTKDGSSRTAAPSTESPTSPPAAAPVSQSPAAVEQDVQQAGSNNDEREESGCPICQFIEAGPCGEEHKVWVACRQEAKNDGADFVQHCADQFRAFFGCMLQHQDYYAPFLDAFHVDVDKSQQAIDTNQQQKEQQPTNNGQSKQEQQQQQQNSSVVETCTSRAQGISSGSSSR